MKLEKLLIEESTLDKTIAIYNILMQWSGQYPIDPKLQKEYTLEEIIFNIINMAERFPNLYKMDVEEAAEKKLK